MTMTTEMRGGLVQEDKDIFDELDDVGLMAWRTQLGGDFQLRWMYGNLMAFYRNTCGGFFENLFFFIPQIFGEAFLKEPF